MASLAHVARMKMDALEYLAQPAHGVASWVRTGAEAAVFETVRDATRAAMRLPSRERAFAMPLAGLSAN
jgi:hypothetical protein